jgi:eukaryotic-like serine/threonine-protein kinase
MDAMSGWSAPAATSTRTPTPSSTLEPGRVLGSRYEIIQMLGEGGMGAVYKARDRELDRFVALKVIRPEFAQSADTLHRFKQELILARQVTHRNVIRIFDLGEAEGTKFITMEYVDGRDLKSVLRESGKLEPKRAAEIIDQVCRALEAAHMEGVVHRDLKPQNIMLDKQGKVSVMDFGIARTMEAGGGGMTQTGALVGTPEYMSPEQAKGEKVDGRTDLFALGIIFYELLTGASPYKAETAMASLYKRTKEVPQPPVEKDPSIPRPLSNIVVHCLQIDKEKRYASATEILQDLAVFQGTRAGSVTLSPSVRFSSLEVMRRWRWLAAAAGVLLIALAGLWYHAKSGSRGVEKPPVTGPSISLAILPFANGSGDQSLDWLGSSLADMLSTDVGQSSHVRAVSPDRVHQIMHDLQISPDSFSDAATVRRLAEMSNADTIVWGQYARFGEQFRVDATLRDIKHDRNVSFKVEAANQQDLLQKVDGLAQTIRDSLSLQPNIADELKAQSFKPSSKSVDAIRFFSQGTNLARAGKNLEALKDFQSATLADPNFALAYAKLGQAFANLGHDTEAEQASRKAVELSETLPAREKYLIAANDARIERDYPKAIQYYETLAASAPDDPEIQFELGRLYEDSGAVDKAHDRYSKVLAGDPNNVSALLALGRLEIRRSNPQGALDYSNRALPLAIQFGNDEAKGTILQVIGVSYDQLDKEDEALRYFQQALEVRRKLDDKRGIAVTLDAMAQIQESGGKSAEAQKNYEEALKIRREIGDKNGLGGTLLNLGGFHLDLGHYDQALELFKQALQVDRDLGNESSQGLCLNNIGLTYLSKADYEDALTNFQQALDLRRKSQIPEDTALTLHNLAVTYEDLGQYDKALSNFEGALDLYRNSGDKRGLAMESYAMGKLFGYQGRFGAALNAKQEALKTFTELQDRTYWMAEVSSGYGKSLSDAGRFDDAQKPLADALSLARDLKIDGTTAQALDFQGESLFYQGNLKGAMTLYNQGLQFATRSKEQDKVLLSKFHIAQATLEEGRPAEAAAGLTKIAAEADTSGMKSLQYDASVALGEILVEQKQYDRARQQLERAIAGAEKLELRPTLAQAHYSLATALRLGGHPADAASHYREALRYVDEIRKDAGTDAFLERSDFKQLYTESSRWAQAKPN